MSKVLISRQLKRLEKIKKWVPVFLDYYNGVAIPDLAIRYKMSLQYLNKVTKYPYTYPHINDIFLAWCKVMEITPSYYANVQTVRNLYGTDVERMDKIKKLPSLADPKQADLIYDKVDALLCPEYHIDSLEVPDSIEKPEIQYNISFHLLCMGAPFASVARYLDTYPQALIKLCNQPTDAPIELRDAFNTWLSYNEMSLNQFQEAREMNKNVRVFELGFNYTELVRSQPNSAEQSLS